jgi:hypothetical protein
MPWPDIFLKTINQRRLVGCVTPRPSLGQALVKPRNIGSKPWQMTGPKANNVMGAMMKMKKIDIQVLKDAVV